MFTASFSGTRLRIESEIQGREVHHRAGPYDQRQRMGLTRFPCQRARHRGSGDISVFAVVAYSTGLDAISL